MPITILKLTGTKDVQSDFDSAKDTPEASVFTLRMLDSRVMGQIRDSALSLAQHDSTRVDNRPATLLNTHESNFKMLQFGLVGWRNVFDANGDEVKFETVTRIVGQTQYTVADPDVLMALPQVVIDELAIKVKQMNTVTVEETKN
jgi:hypothetical protein